VAPEGILEVGTEVMFLHNGEIRYGKVSAIYQGRYDVACSDTGNVALVPDNMIVDDSADADPARATINALCLQASYWKKRALEIQKRQECKVDWEQRVWETAIRLHQKDGLPIEAATQNAGYLVNEYRREMRL
jgi:hypothetical protein